MPCTPQESPRQIEAGLYLGVAALGIQLCHANHLFVDGHLHGLGPDPALALAVDGVWVFGLLAAGLLGCRSRFPGAKATGILALLLGLGLAATGLCGTPGVLISGPIAAIALLHFGGGIWSRRSARATKFPRAS